MNLPEELTAPIRTRLKDQASLSDHGIEEIMNGLEANTSINWNLLLNNELKAKESHETDT